MISRSNKDVSDGQLSKELADSSEGQSCNRQKSIPALRFPFPSNKERQPSYTHEGLGLSFKEMHPKKLLTQHQEENPTGISQQRLKWFSVRRLRRSLKRRRKDEKKPVRSIAKSEEARPQNLASAPSIQTQDTKKSVRFKEALTEVRTFEQTDDSDDDESQSLFNYYYDLITSNEGNWSIDDDEDSYADSSTEESENQCFIDFVSAPPLACHGFAPG